MNRSTSKISFQVVYGRSPKGVIDLVKLPKVEDRRSIDSNNFVESMHDIHEQVKRKLQQSNASYKQKANLHKKLKVFKEGDTVMTHLRIDFSEEHITNSSTRNWFM